MTADDLMRLINRYVEACDDLGNGLFEKPLTTTDALHAKATALHGQILDEVYRLHALAAAQPPAAMPVPTGWICRHKQQVADAEEAFPGQPHDYLWKYTHGTRDMAECEGYGDFDVVRLYATPQAQSVPATGAQPDPMDWPLPCDVTVGHGTMRKGVRLGTLVARMKVLYHMATGRNADDVAGLTIQQREAMGAAFLTELGVSPTPPQPVEPAPAKEPQR